MCYICGKSSNKIIHFPTCGYVQQIPKKNRKYFEELKDATDNGYVYCRRCARIALDIRREKKDLSSFCRKNGIVYQFNPSDGALDVLSPSGEWKIVVSGKKHHLWLYHKNESGRKTEGPFPGFHSQKVCRDTICDYMKYIIGHDIYRIDHPLYGVPDKKPKPGTKAWRKLLKREKAARRRRSIRYVIKLLDEVASEKQKKKRSPEKLSRCEVM